MNRKTIFTSAFYTIKKEFAGTTTRQTLSLYGSEIIALIIGILTGVINTRTLGPVGYGILAFFGTTTSFTVLFFRFGTFSATGVMLAHCKDKIRTRELIGASVVIAFIIGIFYSCFIFFISFFIDGWFKVEIGWILRWASLMLIALPMTLLITQIGKGANAIHRLSAFNILRPALYLGGALLMLFAIKIEPVHLILLNLFTIVITITIVIHTFHPLFSHLREIIRAILEKTKEYGFHLYIGQISDQSANQLSGLLIPFFINTTQLGFFSLATMMTDPMVGLSRCLATSLFRDFAQADEIPKKVIYYNVAWLAMCVILINIFGGFLIGFLFSKDFLPVAPILLPLSIAAFFQGMYQPYNVFLGAHMRGKELRNNSIIVAVIFFIGNIILIPTIGIYGAAISLLLGYGTSYNIYRYYYKKYLKS